MLAEKSNAIVLRVTEFSETSCIGTFFTRDFGKLTLIAKGARRPKSPFEAALDVLAVCRIVFLHKSSSMGTLTEAKLERRFRNRRLDLDWLYAAFYVIELLKSLLEEGDPHPELFDLAVETIAEMDCRSSEAKPFAVGNDSESDGVKDSEDGGKICAKNNKRSTSTKTFELNACLLRFEVGLLKHLGHFPSLNQCVGCGRERTTENSVTFGLNNGGVLCPKCRSSQTNLIQVSSPGIRHLDELRQQLDEAESMIAATKDAATDRNFGSGLSFVRESSTAYQRTELNEELAKDLTTVCGSNAPLGELRKLMNQYLAMLIGHEPRVIRFLAELSKLETQ